MKEESHKICEKLFDAKLKILETKYDEKINIVDERFRHRDEALQLAREMLSKRLDLENNIREELRNQAATFITKIEYEGKHELLNSKINSISEKACTIDGKVLGLIFVATIVISVVVSILTIIVAHITK